jgi:acetyl-CoA carboxylase carboxyltransferase component
MLRLSRHLLPFVQRTSPARTFALSSFENRLNEIKAQAVAGGGEKRVAAQHAKGKLTARERLSVLLDAGSFREYDQVIYPSSAPAPAHLLLPFYYQYFVLTSSVAA